MVRMLRIGVQAAAATTAGSGGTVGDLAEDVVEPAALDPQTGDRPSHGRGRDRRSSATTGLPSRGKTISASPSPSLTGSTAATPGRRASSARTCGIGAGGDAEAHGIVMARALGELCRGPVGEDAAMRDDDRPAAHRLDLFEQMGRDDDRLLGPHRCDDPAHLVLLVGVEPVGRLVEDQHLGIVQQRLRHPDPAFEALRQCLDRLMQDLGDPDHLDDAADALLCFGAGKAADMGDEVEKIGRRHVRIGRRALGQIADMPSLRRSAAVAMS